MFLIVRRVKASTVYHANDYLSIPIPSLPDVTPEWIQTAEKAIQQHGIEENALPVKSIPPAKEYKRVFGRRSRDC